MSRRLLYRLPRLATASPPARLVATGVLLLAAGGLAGGTEAIALGRITAPVQALGVLGVTLLPVGLVAMLRTAPRRRGRPDADDDVGEGPGGGGGGGRGPGHDGDPRPTGGGGVTVDWERFERDFRAYAERAGAHPATADSSRAHTSA